ncbi:high-affinity Cu transporter CTR3 [Aspergillus lucknowensis]|uniref:Copper transport protein n=1 Tax=Aspergillus lucknowensis TaxID=176173 RepID=A0ABR4LI57_9EURO
MRLYSFPSLDNPSTLRIGLFLRTSPSSTAEKHSSCHHPHRQTKTSQHTMDHDMGGMDMGGGGDGAQCVISMLWNWTTIDSCFLARSWHIRSRGMFAGSCIGVILLVIILEFLRRIAREYDAFIVHRAQIRAQTQHLSPSPSSAHTSTAESPPSTNEDHAKTTTPTAVAAGGGGQGGWGGQAAGIRVRPNLTEQFVRALLHMLQFAVAYFVMLLAMYFNGYIIICIFIGAFLGSFIFSWEYLGSGGKENDATAVTKCCG